MAYKDKARQKEFQHQHYLSNKQRYLDKIRSRENKVKMLVRKYKEKPCLDCGIQYPYYVMQYDHLGLAEKSADLSRIYLKGWGLSRVLNEIEKCEVVCGNCHAERTYKRRLASLV